MKNIYAGLLFMHGHIQDPALAISLAGEEPQQLVQAPSETAPREVVAKKAKPARRAWFRSHAVSSIACTTAVAPFR